MTGKQKVEAYSKQFMDSITAAYYGEPVSDLLEKANSAKLEAEQDKQRAEQEKQRISQEKYNILCLSALYFHNNDKLPPEKIAQILGVDIQTIQEILKKHLG